MPKKDPFEAFANNTTLAFSVAQEDYHAVYSSKEMPEVKTKSVHLSQSGLLQVSFEVEYLNFKILLCARARKKKYRNKFDITITVSIRAEKFLESNTYRAVMTTLPFQPNEYKSVVYILKRAYSFGFLVAETNTYQPESVEDHINHFIKSAIPNVYDEAGSLRLIQPERKKT